MLASHATVSQPTLLGTAKGVHSIGLSGHREVVMGQAGVGEKPHEQGQEGSGGGAGDWLYWPAALTQACPYMLHGGAVLHNLLLGPPR